MMEATAILPADGWTVVRRLDDEHHPRVWLRARVIAFVVERDLGGEVTVTPITPAGHRAPLRPAAEGRDGADYLQHLTDAPDCKCSSPQRIGADWLLLDDTYWCAYCGGRCACRAGR